MRKYVTPGRTAAFADGRSDFRPAGNRFLPGFIQPENTSYQQKMGELTVYFAQGGQRAETDNCLKNHSYRSHHCLFLAFLTDGFGQSVQRIGRDMGKGMAHDWLRKDG